MRLSFKGFRLKIRKLKAGFDYIPVILVISRRNLSKAINRQRIKTFMEPDWD